MQQRRNGGPGCDDGGNMRMVVREAQHERGERGTLHQGAEREHRRDDALGADLNLGGVDGHCAFLRNCVRVACSNWSRSCRSAPASSAASSSACCWSLSLALANREHMAQPQAVLSAEMPMNAPRIMPAPLPTPQAYPWV